MAVGNIELGSFLKENKNNPPVYGYWPNATLKLFITQACNLGCRGCFNQSHLRTITGKQSAVSLTTD